MKKLGILIFVIVLAPGLSLSLLPSDVCYGLDTDSLAYKLDKVAWVAKQPQGIEYLGTQLGLMVGKEMRESHYLNPTAAITLDAAQLYSSLWNDPQNAKFSLTERLFEVGKQFDDDRPLYKAAGKLAYNIAKETVPGAKTVLTIIEKSIPDLYDYGKQDPEFGQEVLDAQSAPLSGVSIKNTKDEILPELPEEIRDLFDLVEAGNLSREAADHVLTDNLDKLQEKTENILNIVKDIDEKTTNMIDYMNNAALREKIRQDAENHKMHYATTISGAKSSIYVLSTLVGFGNPKLGNEIGVIGNSAIQIADAFDKYNNTLDDMKGMGAVILTGDILGAAMQIFSLFSSAEGPEDLILTQIDGLRQQIDQIREEMHERFDRIDTKLNEIGEKLDDVLEKLDWDSQRIHEHLNEIQDELQSLQSQLAGFQRDIIEVIYDSEIQELLDGIVYGTGYEELYPDVPMPFQSTEHDFDGFRNCFYNWGRWNMTGGNYPRVRNSLFAGSYYPTFSDTDLLIQMEKPLSQTINFLVQYPEKRFGLAPPYAWQSSNKDSRVGNPDVWENAALSMVELIDAWPWHAARVQAHELEEVLHTGTQLQDAMAWFRTAGTSGRRDIFSKVIERYLEEANSFSISNPSSFLFDIEETYLNDPVRKELLDGIDIWAGSGQAVTFLPDSLGTVTAQGSFYLENSNSEGLKSAFGIPSIIRLTDRLDKATNNFSTTLRMSLGSQYSNEDCHLWAGWEYCTQYTYASLQGVLELNYGGYKIGTRRLVPYDILVDKATFTRWKINGSTSFWNHPDGFPIDFNQWIKDNWKYGDCLRCKFESQAQSVPLTSDEQLRLNALYGNLSAFCTNILNGHQLSFYQQMLTSTSFQNELDQLSSFKQLLRDYVSLTLPRSLQENDYLRTLLFKDRNEIFNAYTAAIQNLTNGESHPRVDLPPSLEGDIKSLEAAINGIFTTIDDRTFVESEQRIDLIVDLLRNRLASLKALATDDLYKTAQESAISMASPGVLANDAKQLGSILQAVIVSGPQYGILDFGSDGSFTYQPVSGFTGIDSFQYKATNTITMDEGFQSIVESDPATVYLHVGSFFYDKILSLLMDDDENGETTDQSGNGNDSIIHGAFFMNGGGLSGTSAFEFSWANADYIQVPYQASQTATDQLTLEAWVYPTAWDNIYAGYNRIVSKQPVYLLRGANGRPHFQIQSENQGYKGVIGPETLSLNAWHYLVGTFDGLSLHLYVDGDLKNSLILPESDRIATNENDICIGEYPWLNEGFTGLIDNVAISRRAKTASEVKTAFDTIMGSIKGNCDGDRDVDGADLAILLETFYSLDDDTTYDPRADLDNDGDVDENDLALFTPSFGKSF